LRHLDGNRQWSNATQNITPTIHYSVTGLTNKSPMREKRPVNK
jgi:hypothetical protein